MQSGRRLEILVFQLLRVLVSGGNLGLIPESCRTYLNRDYYSKDRNDYIRVDVSIEMLPDGTTEPALIWIWECKDYTSPVPVNDVEEFHAKLLQLGTHRVKGTMITTARYQDAAVSFALSHGIGLTRLETSGGPEVVPTAVDSQSQLRILFDQGFYTFDPGGNTPQPPVSGVWQPPVMPELVIHTERGSISGSFFKVALVAFAIDADHNQRN